MEVKFEEQFKHRDESNVNAPCAAHRKDSKKPYSTEAFVVSRNSIYRRTWQSGNHRHSQHRTARGETRSGRRREKQRSRQRASDDSNAMMGEWQHRG
jgi:hypothetical protein